MKESELYLNFLKRNWLWFFLPIFFSLVISIYIYAQIPTQVRINQTFKMKYDLNNIDTLLALTDQAVAELREQRFAQNFPNSSASIFKSAPLNISVEATSLRRDTSYALLLKEVEYLRTNFSIEELSSPEISLIEPNLFKYLISGMIIGGLLGLIISLGREYIKNY